MMAKHSWMLVAALSAAACSQSDGSSVQAPTNEAVSVTSEATTSASTTPPLSTTPSTTLPSTTAPSTTTGQASPASTSTVATAEVSTDDVCESFPVTPPSLVDGGEPGEPTIVNTDAGRVAQWGPADSIAIVRQSNGEPAATEAFVSEWLDGAVDTGRAIEVGDWQATSVAVGDPPLGGISILLRNTADGCTLTYSVGPGLLSDEAESLASEWVDALVTGEPIDPPGHADLGVGYFSRRFDLMDDSRPPLRVDEFDASGAIVQTFSDEDVVALIDGFDADPDDRYRVEREFYDGDASRWRLFDRDDGDAEVLPASVCESAGYIVAPPRFVSADVVVIAQLCTTLHTGAATDDPPGDGDVQVMAVDLAAEQPSESILWSTSAPGLGANSFTKSVRLSAQQLDDGTFAAIVSGNGDLEVSSQTYLFVGDQAIDITRRGHTWFALQPGDLITQFD